jgi:GDSL-like lipase/acylhydrolase family protein
MNGHVALLGDSILDNGAYTSGGPDVVSQLTSMLPSGWRASLLAVDGAMMGDLAHQLDGLPADVSHVVVSIGGNDVLLSLDVLRLKVKFSLDAFLSLGKLAQGFERGYRSAIDRVRRLGLRTTICSIYNGNLSGEEGAAARVALMAFNDVILRVAFESQLQVIDLRLVCTEPADYANPIEPSSRGGEKIARAIARSLGLATPTADPSRVYF